MEKPIGSPSSEEKIVIKLKIPKLGPAAGVADGEKTPEEDVIGVFSTASSVTEGRKVCLECGKEFSSGKALGGHMRVHVGQSGNRNPNFQKPAKTTKFKLYGYESKPYYMNSVNDEGKPICSQCGKTFPSMKSLFGHMRCHPERVWRGILPPPNTPSAAVERRRTETYDGGDQVVDLTKFLRGWTVTEQRGRKSLKPLAENNEEDDAVLLEAVEDLMRLANGDVTESVVTQRQLKVEVTEGSKSNSNSNLMNKGKAVMESEEEIEVKIPVNFEKEDEVVDEYSDGRNTGSPNKMMKKRKKMKLMNELLPNDVVPMPLPEQQQQAECKYKCTTCNKCFTSHQALGGHRSSHNKPKFIPTEENAFSGENSEKEVVFSCVHQCKICDKIFATGQALGGHQRCHWTGITSVVQAPSSQITSAGEAGSQTECDLDRDRKVLDFDLNESPPVMMEIEEDGNGNGNGDASSSYNSNVC